jgi:hypothetical protein
MSSETGTVIQLPSFFFPAPLLDQQTSGPGKPAVAKMYRGVDTNDFGRRCTAGFGTWKAA